MAGLTSDITVLPSLVRRSDNNKPTGIERAARHVLDNISMENISHQAGRLSAYFEMLDQDVMSTLAELTLSLSLWLYNL